MHMFGAHRRIVGAGPDEDTSTGGVGLRTKNDDFPMLPLTTGRRARATVMLLLNDPAGGRELRGNDVRKMIIADYNCCRT